MRTIKESEARRQQQINEAEAILWRWPSVRRGAWKRRGCAWPSKPRSRSIEIRLADLLIEVENDLGCSVHFQRPGETRVDPGDVCALLAAILAHGCNLGLYTMEKVAPAIADRRLKYVSDWRLVEENPRAALAGIVHGLSRLDAAGHWGDGTTSASDGQRFAMPHKVLQRTYSTRVNDFALECYSFVADNDAPFYSRPIECTDRDAPVVLDGVLSHESALDLEAHDTDTHGYTEINVAAFAMVREISRLAAAPDFPFDPDLLRHVSPIEWKNVILYGEITIDPAKLTMRDPSRVFLHESCRYPFQRGIAPLGDKGVRRHAEVLAWRGSRVWRLL